MARREGLGLSAVRTEGAILPPSVLARVQGEDSKLNGLKPEDYGLSGERLREAASRAWNALQSAWAKFSQQREKLPSGDVGTSVTRNRWLNQVFRALDYGALDLQRDFPTSHVYGHVPIHTVGFTVGLDERTKGKTPHGVVQTFLNASDDHLWGIVTNGLRWRLLRDSASLSRQALVEFDLEAIFTGQLYDEFLLFWLLCHQSRLKSEKPEECWLEKWSKAAGEEGKRALDTLRDGVQKAIEALGQGFLKHPHNTALRAKVRSGALEKQDYYRQLLRLVYRTLFLFVAEDRGLLFAPGTPEPIKATFTQFYGTQRLRLLAERLRGSGRHHDLYLQFKLVTAKLADPNGCPELGLSPLGGFLFAPETCPDLDSAQLANTDFLDALRHLAITQEGGRQARVDYKNLGSEEFGSVYESLLELHPELRSDGTHFSLLSASGNERKTTGSYYTPDSLIQVLLDEALEPVVDAAVKHTNPEQAILNLKVVDPAAGSGHFLIAAAHRLARRLAQVRTGDDEPSVEATRKALRDVIGRCLYAVDLNPMAVELCKVALWMEALEPGKPLSFLDHHIQCGNALLGTTPALLKQGIPDAAFTPIEGDDKAVCSEFKKRNKTLREHGAIQLSLEDAPPWERQGELANAMLSIAAVDDASVAGVTERASRWESLVTSAAYENNRLLADAWCAAFVWKKQRSDTAPPYYPITQEHFAAIRKSPHNVEPWIKDEVRRLAKQYQFFHWHLAFPDVFGAEGEGGFDVVLGNPPWKMPEEDSRLEEDSDSLLDTESFSLADSSKLKRERTFLTGSDRFPLSAKNRLQLARLFAELFEAISSPTGATGIIVPSTITVNAFDRPLWSHWVNEKLISCVWDFINAEKLFEDVDSRQKFAIICLKKSKREKLHALCWMTNPSQIVSQRNKVIELSKDDLFRYSGDELALPHFRNSADLVLLESAIDRFGRVGASKEWTPEYVLLGATTDKDFVRERRRASEAEGDSEGHEWIPVYEGKMVTIFDHRVARVVWKANNAKRRAQEEPLTSDQKSDPSILATPLWEVPRSLMASKDDAFTQRGWDLSLCDVTSSLNERTAITAAVPLCFATHNLPLVRVCSGDAHSSLLFLGALGSLALDYFARLRVATNHLTEGIFASLPIPNPQFIRNRGAKCFADQWGIVQRVLELTYTAYDMTPFARDCGYDGDPFIWNDERRFQLRCELDAAYFHLYGINQGDLDYIMGTFPIVKRKDEAAHGTYRTRDRILEIYDQMAAGRFVSPLDPPPAHGWKPSDEILPNITDNAPVPDADPVTPPPPVEDTEEIELPTHRTPTPKANVFFQRATLAAEIVSQMHEDPTFGHVKFMKVFEVCELDANLGELETQYYRQAAGPLNNTLIRSLDSQLAKQKWYRAERDGTRYVYRPLEKVGGHRTYYDRYWGDRNDAIQRVIRLFQPLRTREAEIIATLYTAWNDLLLAGLQPTDDDVIRESRDNWHDAKQAIMPNEWQSGLVWMRKNELIPRGTGKHTLPTSSSKASRSGDVNVSGSSPQAQHRVGEPPAKNEKTERLPEPDLGVTNDASDQFALVLPIGRVRVNGQDAELLERKVLGSGRTQYRVILDATGEIKNFVSPPATVEEG